MEWGTFSLSTVLASGVISAIISSVFGLWQKKMDYRQSYYKLVLDKRIKLYEEIQLVLSNFVIFRTDDNASFAKTYYIAIADKSKLENILDIMTACAKNKIWFSRDMFNEFHDLYAILLRCYSDDEKAIILNVSKKNIEIDEIVAKMRDILAKDLLELYDVPNFLHELRHQNWFHKKFAHVPFVRNYIK